MIQGPVGNDRGAALLITLMAVALVAALGLILLLGMATDTWISSGHRVSHVAFYAADAILEHTLQEIRGAPSLDAILNGSMRSSLAVTVEYLPDGTTLDLPSLGATVQRDSDATRVPHADRPAWRLFGYGPLVLLTGEGSDGPAYLAIWVADDELDGDGNPASDSNGILLLHAEAYGERGGRRVIEAALARVTIEPDGSEVPDEGAVTRLVAWREVRD